MDNTSTVGWWIFGIIVVLLVVLAAWWATTTPSVMTPSVPNTGTTTSQTN